MKRKAYFDFIEEKLSTLIVRVETRGKLNVLDLHLHSENFYLYLFNCIYNYQLENLNQKLQNVPAIDLIDHVNKLIVQVSATCTKDKIESALSKSNLKEYNSYRFTFISISKDASSLRGKTFENPHSLSFDPAMDIYDVPSILTEIQGLEIDHLSEVYTLIKKELGDELNVKKLDSNLAFIINILSNEEWNEANKSTSINSFEIERKIEFNELESSRDIINEYCVYYNKVDEKYKEFDKQGVNKSNSVLATIRKAYWESKELNNGDQIFNAVIDKVKAMVVNSKNFKAIAIDELDLCIDILVVDAFIRCKILESPQEYNYADT